MLLRPRPIPIKGRRLHRPSLIDGALITGVPRRRTRNVVPIGELVQGVNSVTTLLTAVFVDQKFRDIPVMTFRQLASVAHPKA